MPNENSPIDYDGHCIFCGSEDGTIVKGPDGKYRNMCRYMGCPVFYRAVPVFGFDTVEECRDPANSPAVKGVEMTVGQYIGV